MRLDPRNGRVDPRLVAGERLPLAAPARPGHRYFYDTNEQNYFHDPSGRLTCWDVPCMYVAANFPMELVPGSAVGHSATNGATRFVRGTARTRQPPPAPADEPDWMRYATTPLAAGGCVLRDIRTWHGGTPNVSGAVRAIPQASFCPSWFAMRTERTMPRGIFDGLSPHGQRICRMLVAPPGVVIKHLVYGEPGYPTPRL